MGRLTHSKRAAVRPPPKRSRAFVSSCLRAALKDVGTTQRGLARTLDRDPKTIGRWCRGETRVNVEEILEVKRLGRAFRKRFCVHDHEEPAGYIARKRKRARVKR